MAAFGKNDDVVSAPKSTVFGVADQVVSGDDTRPAGQSAPPRGPRTFMDTISNEMNGGGAALEPDKVVKGIGNSLGRTTQAWGDMFSGNANPHTLAEMVPVLGPAAVDASNKLFTPGHRLEGLTDAAMLLGPSVEGGLVRESRMPLQYRGEGQPLSFRRPSIPSVPESVIDASHLMPGAAPLRVGARVVNALGRMVNRPDPSVSALPSGGRQVYNTHLSAQSPTFYDPHPLPSLGKQPMSRQPSFAARPYVEDIIDTNDLYDTTGRVMGRPIQELEMPPDAPPAIKSAPIPMPPIWRGITDEAPQGGVISDATPIKSSLPSGRVARVPTADELAFEPTPKRFVDPRESQVMAQPLPTPSRVDTPATARARANTSRAKFDENGKRNQLK